ncbi:MAG: histidine--tRNA ligase, partial [Chloroflexaceae bacterium]|nr:histidine--tRNA ligase [Chloroflexaceae bacterium]
METEKNLIPPQTLKGFQDLLPSQMIARTRLIEDIRTVYERYGFVPLQTPTLEYLSTLTGSGGEETNKQMFRLHSPEGDAIAMRFDLTVPFARLVAQYPNELKLPLRRYQIGSVFRADKPGPGRFREFTQFDIDAAGSESVAVDAEILAAMTEVMHRVGLRNDPDGAAQFRISVNDRTVMNALLVACQVTAEEQQKHVLRVIDKLQKIGLEHVRQELGNGRIDESGDPIRGVGLQAEQIDQILHVVAITGDSRRDVIARLAALLPETPVSQTALQEMHELADALDALGVQEHDVVFDPSLTRGLDYYTGPVFEATLPAAPEFGSVMGGGRYNQLVERFLETPVPATGASIGI